jgi:hypothetical protein
MQSAWRARIEWEIVSYSFRSSGPIRIGSSVAVLWRESWAQLSTRQSRRFAALGSLQFVYETSAARIIASARKGERDLVLRNAGMAGLAYESKTG